MRNLKKILALVLALVMSMSLVSVASAKVGFADAADIDHQEAADVLYSLGVIDGVGNNTFAPDGNVTRAQMAKMITIITLGDVEVSAFKGVETDLTDINGHWAEAYIKYCYSQGIIAGKGNGIFDPNDNVTAAEAAKMLLVAIGYHADIQVYTGSQWKVNVIRDAQLSAFFDELVVTADQDLTRDEAAQMIYNAILTKTIERTSGIDRETGEITDTYTKTGDPLLEETFGVLTYEGILDYDPADYDADKGEYTYDVDGRTIVSTTDYTDLYMHNVKVLYKVNKDSTITVYGIYAHNSSVLATGLMDSLSIPTGYTDRVKLGSTFKTTTGDLTAPIVEFLAGDTGSDVAAEATYATNANTKVAFNAELIDNTGDGKVDLVLVYPFTVEKVNYVGTKTFTTEAVITGIGGASYKFEDVIVYEGIEEGDYVAKLDAANSPINQDTFVYLEKVADKSEAVKKSDDKIKFAGTWYDTGIYYANVGNYDEVDPGAAVEYVEVNGFVFYLDTEVDTTSAEDFAIINKMANEAEGVDQLLPVQLLKADGSKVTVNVKLERGYTAAIGDLVRVEVDDDDTILHPVNSAMDIDTTDFDVFGAVATKTPYNADLGSAGTLVPADDKDAYLLSEDGTIYYIADDAVVFVAEDADSFSKVAGTKLQENEEDVTVAFYAAELNEKTGYMEISLIYVGGDLGTEATEYYGYVTDDVVKYKDGSKFYVEVTFWDGTKEQTINTKSAADDTGVVAAAYALAKGDVFTYTLNSSNKFDTVTEFASVVAGTGATAANKIEVAAVIGWDGKNLTTTGDYFTKADGTLAGGTAADVLDVDKDTVILYVDSDATEGVEGGALRLATKDTLGSNTSYYANVKYVSDSSNEDVALLIVDVNSDVLALK